MSIIHDALKKAEETKKEKQDENPVSAETVNLDLPPLDSMPVNQDSQLIQKYKRNRNISRTIRLFFLLLIVAAVVFSVSPNFSHHPLNPINFLHQYVMPQPEKMVDDAPKAIEPKKVIESANNLAQTLISNVKSEIAKPKEEFALSGIAYSEDEPIVIINNSIYTLGDYVGGAQIVKISEKSVLLNKEGEKIEIQLK